jgi:hypothetical protein
MNFFDFIKPKDDEVLTGIYYEHRPIVDGYDGAVLTDYNDNGVPFRYDILDPESTTYGNIAGTLRADRTTQSIKTDADIDFKVDSYVKGQDGGFYQITELGKQIAPPETKQALKWFKKTIKTTKIIRLIEVDNPFKL